MSLTSIYAWNKIKWTIQNFNTWLGSANLKIIFPQNFYLFSLNRKTSIIYIGLINVYLNSKACTVLESLWK